MEPLPEHHRKVRMEATMSLVLSSGEICPKCRKALMQGVVEAHPSRRDLALHNFQCADCGPVKTKVISLTLKPDMRPGDVSDCDQTATA
jgi:hypothetical protein